MRLFFSSKVRRERQRKEIAAIHATMANDPGVVGKVARLYDYLALHETHFKGLEVSQNIEHERRRAMFIGNIAFNAHTGNNVPVAVRLNRITNIQTAEPYTYAEIGFLVGDEEISRIRGRTYTNRKGQWVMEGTATPSSSAYTSTKTPQLEYPEGFGPLVDSLARLTANTFADATSQTVPFTHSLNANTHTAPIGHQEPSQ